jgi:hypothetical protein
MNVDDPFADAGKMLLCATPLFVRGRQQRLLNRGSEAGYKFL